MVLFLRARMLASAPGYPIPAPGKDIALKMISGSGKGHNGQVWFIEPARWDLLVENTPRMQWQDQLPNETPFAYAHTNLDFV